MRRTDAAKKIECAWRARKAKDAYAVRKLRLKLVPLNKEWAHSPYVIRVARILSTSMGTNITPHQLHAFLFFIFFMATRPEATMLKCIAMGSYYTIRKALSKAEETKCYFKPAAYTNFKLFLDQYKVWFKDHLDFNTVVSRAYLECRSILKSLERHAEELRTDAAQYAVHCTAPWNEQAYFRYLRARRDIGCVQACIEEIKSCFTMQGMLDLANNFAETQIPDEHACAETAKALKTAVVDFMRYRRYDKKVYFFPTF